MKSTAKKFAVGSILFCLACAGCQTSQAQISVNSADLYNLRPAQSFTYGLYYHRVELFNGTNSMASPSA